MVVAFVIRIPFLLRPPELSDDAYRYLWDGLQLLAGHNPYSLPPDRVVPDTEAAAALRSMVNHGDLVTIYPPMAQIIFGAGAALGHGITSIKALLVGIDLTACIMILKLLKALNLPPWRAILYAWHPLAVLEISGSGHVDGAGMTLFLLALIVLITRPKLSESPAVFMTTPLRYRFGSRHTAGILFGLAALVKLSPLIFLPACLALLTIREQRNFLAGSAIIIFGLCIPFFPGLRNLFTTLGIYARHWEFSGLAYRTLHTVLPGDEARFTLGILFAAVVAALAIKLFSRRKGLCNGAGILGIIHETQRDFFSLLFNTFAGTAVAFLFFTPTLHPWYALPLVFFLPFTATPSLLILSWSVLLAYKVLISYSILGTWIEDSATPLIIWLPTAAALLLTQMHYLRRKAGYDPVHPSEHRE